MKNTTDKLIFSEACVIPCVLLPSLKVYVYYRTCQHGLLCDRYAEKSCREKESTHEFCIKC